MSSDFTADGEQLAGNFTSTYDIDGSNALTMACWFKRSAAQWALDTDCRIITLNNNTLDPDSSSSAVPEVGQLEP